jgi:import inner membrane translocase subunit TIM23
MSRSTLRPLAALSRQAQAQSNQIGFTSSRSLATSSATTDRITPDDPVKPLPLTWPTYLGARRSRKLWSTIASVPSTFAGLSLGGGYFASIEADPSHLIMGMEPM